MDDSVSSADRVRLADEEGYRYDEVFYTTLLVRAAESVLSPLGWDEAEIRRHLADERTTKLSRYG